MRHALIASALMAALPAMTSVAGPALAEAATRATGDETVTTFTLPNGLDAIVIEDRRAPVVVHMLWYNVGSADEPPGKSGIAHFLEHLMFKGTDDLEPGEFSEVVAAQGGSDNAFTSDDYTGYFQRVASDRLGLMMEMEADRMRDLVLGGDDMLTERSVVLEERAQRTDSNPGALFGEMRAAVQYLNHPYRIPIIGWKSEIEKLTLQDALDFYGVFYAPNNATLIVAGNVDPAEVRALAERHYGPLEPTPGLERRERPQEPPQIAPRRLTYEDGRVSNPYVMRTYLAPERDPGAQEEAAALAILAQVLGGSSATSLMGRTLEQDEKTALYTSAFYDGTKYDDTTFGLIVMPVPGRSLEEAEADMDRMIATLIEEGVDADQLDRIKSQIRASDIYGRDSLQGRAREYGVAVTSGLTVEDVVEWPGLLDAVTAEQVVAAAQRVFDIDASVTGYLTQPEAVAGAETAVEPAVDPEPAAVSEPETMPAPEVVQ